MATIGVYVLSLIHTLTAGTDARMPWLRALLIATGAPIAVLLAARVLHRPPRPASRAAS